MSISTHCPAVTSLRSTLERYILDLFVGDSSTLKPYTQWPGYYTLPNGTRIPAVYVVGENMVPSSWKITGIECTIEDVPEIPRSFSVGTIVSMETWSVSFTNYGTNNGTKMPLSMLDIRRRVARVFPADEAVYLARTEVTFESLKVRILGPTLNPLFP